MAKSYASMINLAMFISDGSSMSPQLASISRQSERETSAGLAMRLLAGDGDGAGDTESRSPPSPRSH